MKIIKNYISIALFLYAANREYAQGFANLDFESANLVGYSPGNYIPANAAIPSWAAYYGPSNNPTQLNTSIVFYNGQSLGGALVALQDQNANTFASIQGNYSVLLEGSIPAAASTASIAQTGTIPIGTESLTFFANLGGTVMVSFNGQNLSFSPIGNGVNYTIYGANISGFAGQTGQLLFTAPVQQTALLDNIQFSSTAVPEPSEFALAALGATLLVFRHWRKSFQL